MRRTVSALALLLSTGALAAEPPAGKSLFDRWCAECHAAGVGHPGAQQLERLRGTKLALLEARNDLAPEFIRYVVRQGQNAMPPYRPSEITDAQLDQIAQYLGRNLPAGKRRR
jgi:(+)-pinoresinol hydroxylase